MALTWDRRARRRREIKRNELLKEQAKVEEECEKAEAGIKAIEEGIEEQDAIIVEARVREAQAQGEMDRTISCGRAPHSAHVGNKQAAEKEIAEATEIVDGLVHELEITKAKLPEVPEVPEIEDIPLSTQEIAAVALFVLIDVFRVKAWVAGLVVASGLIAWYAVTSSGILEKLGF